MNWSRFDEFDEVIDKYMPDRGQGETMASQIATAVNKLVYKWYNDGDVFDNTYHLSGWCNDLSSYANWLYSHVKGAQPILMTIKNCYSGDEYEQLLFELCSEALKKDFLEECNKLEKVDDIYHCDGRFCFEEVYDEDNEWY